MNVSVGEVVAFGPPGTTKIRGKVIKLGHPKVKIRQLVAGHGQPAGIAWWVPLSPEYITQTFGTLPKPVPPESKIFGGAAGRGSVPVSTGGRYHPPGEKRHTSKRRTSHRPPPPAPIPKIAAGGLTEAWAMEETKKLLLQWKVPAFHVEFSNSMTRTLGLVNYRTRTVSYSRPLWVRATDEQRREVVIHEVAHAVVENRIGRRRGVSHGRDWKLQMIAMGISNPSPYHTVKRDDLRRKRGDTIEISCCGVHKMRITMAKMFKSLRFLPDGNYTSRMRCRSCNQSPDIAPEDKARFAEYVRRGGAPPLRPNQLCGCHEH